MHGKAALRQCHVARFESFVGFCWDRTGGMWCTRTFDDLMIQEIRMCFERKNVVVGCHLDISIFNFHKTIKLNENTALFLFSDRARVL